MSYAHIVGLLAIGLVIGVAFCWVGHSRDREALRERTRQMRHVAEELDQGEAYGRDG